KDSRQWRDKNDPASPPEIQTKILSQLVVSFGKSSIHAVLRTCKKLYEVALPLSVEVFRNTVPYPGIHGPCSGSRNIQFLRYILISKPWLAKNVKTVILGRFSTDHGRDADGKETAQGQESIDQEELAIYQQYIQRRLGQLQSGDIASWCDSWVEDLGNGTSDAQVALILLACRNVQTLYFEVSDSNHFLRLLRMARHISNGSGRSGEPGSRQDGGHYTDISVPLGSLQERTPADIEASELFALPRIRVYEALGVQAFEESASLSFESLPPRASPVEEIALSNSFCTLTIWHILGICRALKKFEFSFYKPDWLGYPFSMMPGDIMHGVLIHRNTLGYLYLNLEEELDHLWDSWPSYYPERLYLGMKLRDMRCLKTLIVGMRALTGMLASKPYGHHDMPLKVEGAPRMVDCLPDSLERLTIHSCELVESAYNGRLKKLDYICVLYHGWRVNNQEIEDYHHKSLESRPGIRIVGGGQMFEAHRHDLWGTFPLFPEGLKNFMSKIYTPHLRRQHLERRMNWQYCNAEYHYEEDPHLFDE
ncbi:unnamed protein product, partial [Clonostachys rosea]